MITFRVAGIPVPQGSSRAFARNGRAHIVSTSARLSAWRTDIATEARAAMAGRPPVDGPVRVTLAFVPAARPASHYLPANRRRPVRELRLDAPAWMASAPDADKLARAGLDALTGVVYLDDRQVVSLHVTKRWPSDAEAPGVTVTVSTEEATR